MTILNLAHTAVRHARSITGFGRNKNYRQIEVALVLLLPDDVQHLIQNWRLDILRRAGRCPEISAPPHVTLKLGFHHTNIEALSHDLASFAQQWDSIELRLGAVRHFDECILFLDVEKTTHFEAMRNSLLSMLKTNHGVNPLALEYDRFHPHVTIVRDLAAASFKSELERFSAIDVKIVCQSNRAALLISVDDHWVTYRVCPLKQTATREPFHRQVLS